MEMKPIPGTSYMATTDGHIWSTKTNRTMRPFRNNHGYPMVSICEDGIRSRHLVHRLVAIAFHGVPPIANAVAMHIDDNPANPRPGNLRWGTRSDNSRDSVSKRRHAAATHPERLARGDRHYFRLHPEKVPRGERAPSSVIDERMALEIRKRAGLGEPVAHIARDFSITRRSVAAIAEGRNWAHLGGPVAGRLRRGEWAKKGQFNG